LNSREVRYLVIGGIAVVIHGVPRATFDLDIAIWCDRQNAGRLLDALLDAGMGTASLTDADRLLSNEITIFRDRLRVDVQTSTPGIDFDTAWANRRVVTVGEIPVPILSYDDLIRSKLAAGRPVDLQDVRELSLRHDT
jgi:hypothetical protein